MPQSPRHVHDLPESGYTGQVVNCPTPGCLMPFIWDRGWKWLHGVDTNRQRKLKAIFTVDRLTGAHDG